MAFMRTEKPATADTVNGLPNVDLLGGLIDSKHNPSTLQAQRLAERFGLTLNVADVVAAHFYGRAA